MNAINRYDAVVIGSGSGGFTMAIGLTGFGKRVAVIEKQFVGGDCTNVGCVPSKTLIHEAGLNGQPAAAAFARVQARRNQLREEETHQLQQIENLDLIFGHARFVDPHTLEVAGSDGSVRAVVGDQIVIATGSRPRHLAIAGLPAERTLTNENLFELSDAPQHLAIVGSGPVAMEMAFAFRKLGSRVTLLTRGARVLTRAVPEASAVLHESLIEHGVAVFYHARPQSYDQASNTLHIRSADHPVAIPAVDRVLLAVGRVRNIDDLGLERAGVRFDPNSGIPTDRYGRTNVPHIYAIGDVTPTSANTHSANAQGRRVVQRIALPFLPANKPEPLYPSATFSDPEVAMVGMLPDQIARRYHPQLIKRIRVEVKDLDRGYTDSVTRGFVMVDVVRLTGRILGATIVGPHAGDLITFFTLAIARGISLYQIYQLVFPYPTYSEGIKKVADAFMRETLPHFGSELTTYLRYRLAAPPRPQPRAVASSR